jgi:Na+/melibiose symporter-like transporter
VGGFLVAWVGIPALTEPGSVSDDALFRLGVAAGPIAAASFLIPLWLFTRFDLSRARHAELRRTLESSQAAESSASAWAGSSGSGPEK